MKFTLTLILFIFISKLYSQKISTIQPNKSDSLLAIEYYNIADSSFRNTRRSLYYTLKAIPLLEKTNQWEKYVYCWNCLAYLYNTLEKFDSLEWSNTIAYTEAKRLLPENHPYIVTALNNLAYTYSTIKVDYKRAENIFKDALDRFTLKDSTDLTTKASIYENLGFLSRKRGDFKTALFYFEEAIRVAETAYNSYMHKYVESNFKTASNYNNIANLYYNLENFDQAIFNINKAIESLESDQQANDNIIYNYYLFLAKALLKAKRYAQYFSVKQKLAIKHNLTDVQNARLNELEYIFHTQNGNSITALRFSDKALKFYPEEKLIERIDLFIAKGQIQEKLHRYKAAMATYQKGLSLLFLNPTNIDIQNTRIPNVEVRSKSSFAELVEAIANNHYIQYNHSKKSTHLQLALDAYYLLVDLQSQMGQEYHSSDSKLYLQQRSNVIYERALKISHKIYENSKDNKHLNDIYFFIQKSKSVLLAEEIQKKENRGVQFIPQSIKDREYQLNVDLHFMQKKKRREEAKTKQDFAKIKSLEQTIFNIKEQQVFLNDSIRQQFPEYYQLYNNQISSISEIQKILLNEGECLVEYFIGTENIYSIIISKQTTSFHVLPPPLLVDSLIFSLQNSLRLSNSKEWKNYVTSACSLYEYLLAPLELDQYQKLILVPDGMLTTLPFEILLKHNPISNQVKDFPYLIKDHNISYAYSSGILLFQNNKSTSLAKPLVVAPVFQNSNKYLKYSLEEAKELKSFGATILSGSQATLKNFFIQNGNYNILHFSTHAEAEDSILKEPVIYFIDSVLYLSDLYLMKSNAQLAVLSACETSLGRKYKGEGVMSLARGFTHAGIPSVVTSLWKVNEKSTSEIMASFYANLKKGQNKDTALRKAKLTYLANAPDFKATPFYWAAFISIGNVHKIDFKTSENKLLFWAIPVGLLMLALTFQAKHWFQ